LELSLALWNFREPRGVTLLAFDWLWTTSTFYGTTENATLPSSGIENGPSEASRCAKSLLFIFDGGSRSSFRESFPILRSRHFFSDEDDRTSLTIRVVDFAVISKNGIGPTGAEFG